jgi:serpin B
MSFIPFNRAAALLSMATVLISSPLFSTLSEDLAQLTEDHSQFAFSLYSALNQADDNQVFSPFSIANCLSMVYLGARGDTAIEMQKTLHLEVDRKNLAKTSFSLNQSLLPEASSEKTYQLNIANAAWVDQGIFILTDFRYALEEQFKAKLGKINFSMADNAMATINTWTAQNTQNKIPRLLSQGDITPATKLLLTNAIYFEGSWTQPFNPKSTQDWPFQPTVETSINVKMMRQVVNTPYYENDLMQAAALPFLGKSKGGGNLALVILLPKSAENFSVLVNEISDEFDDWLSSLAPERIDLKLPRFRLKSRFDLTEPLKKLGMEDAFDENANFAGIDGMRDLVLDKVIHEAFFDLDEQGVSAGQNTAHLHDRRSPVPLFHYRP